MTKVEITPLGDVRCKVGEGPVWDVAEQALYFIDLLSKRLWRYDPATEAFKSWDMPGMIGSMALRQGGGALVALEDGFHTVDLYSGAVTPFALVAGEGVETQFNDGKVDPRGRFLAGSQARSLQEPRPLGSLYRVDPDGQTTRLDGPISIPNGPCWSPDGGTFYFTDSCRGGAFAYDYDVGTGAVANKRPFVDTSDLGGFPDGATVDADGRYWVAVCTGGKIACYLPDGRLDRALDVPCNMVASVMFGGPDLDRLFVTCIDPSIAGRPAEPHGGGLFVIDGLGARGRSEPRFAG
jgi:sugar lactone lactonase YvrE